MKGWSEELVKEILGFIHAYSDCHSLEAELDPEFNDLALNIFKFQYQGNPHYKRYCQRRHKSPLTVKRWEDIPPIPFQMFKETVLACEPIEEAEAVFMTSGSTNKEKRGRHYHPTLEVWDASMVPPFKHYVLPDRDQMTIYVLSPAEDVNENSSLSRYLSLAVKHYGTRDSAFFFSKEAGFDMAGLVSALRKSEAKGEPVLLMGATFAYVHFLDYCRAEGLAFNLPDSSRIFDTGGLKGQAREVTMEELYSWFKDYFSIERELSINMYGMTELSSQLYDRTIATKVKGGQVCMEKIGPAWTRLQVLNPDTLNPVSFGETGLLAHYDLANWNSAVAVLTEDLGYQTKNGFVLLGRTKGSEARGCSIAIDEMLAEQTSR
ncbi:CoF synthetase [Desulfosporosinus sp. FKB]|uniref:LuxE/PaaK family acyltransferase n=1 Tax=Desulfosporosinus sp. FKB TaxID=1969835 RepID=UPI000B4A473E|nr:CoF synthetase [Desulfosporosinus sp. FKB]